MQEGTVFITSAEQFDSAMASVARIVRNLSYRTADGAPMMWEIEVRPSVRPSWCELRDYADAGEG